MLKLCFDSHTVNTQFCGKKNHQPELTGKYDAKAPQASATNSRLSTYL